MVIFLIRKDNLKRKEVKIKMLHKLALTLLLSITLFIPLLGCCCPSEDDNRRFDALVEEKRNERLEKERGKYVVVDNPENKSVDVYEVK